MFRRHLLYIHIYHICFWWRSHPTPLWPPWVSRIMIDNLLPGGGLKHVILFIPLPEEMMKNLTRKIFNWIETKGMCILYFVSLGNIYKKDTNPHPQRKCQYVKTSRIKRLTSPCSELLLLFQTVLFLFLPTLPMAQQVLGGDFIHMDLEWPDKGPGAFPKDTFCWISLRGFGILCGVGQGIGRHGSWSWGCSSSAHKRSPSRS